ncbi:hypothetical protein AVEN_188776-1 [Araneus ventricosus]|uniref:Uncharacterized protein n=1 Tax=Araneus ventricosus TaxID=182803 RepID=A0A4Y2VJH0_ARAVE|nr:hypothetical protein AVEN_188776-1 [Araneus ventricosus]
MRRSNADPSGCFALKWESATKKKINNTSGSGLPKISRILLKNLSFPIPLDKKFEPTVTQNPRWSSGKVSALGRRVAGSKPDSTEDPSCIGPVALVLCTVLYWTCCTVTYDKRPPVGVARNFGDWVPTQASSSSTWLKITRFVPKSPSCCFKTGR